MSDTSNLNGARIVLTGASSGIGAAAAELLSRSGARLFVAGRDAKRTQDIARRVGAAPLIADYASLAEVRALASTLGGLGPIDVLINNAGGYWPSRELSADKLEMTMQVNALAPWLLTRELLPHIHGGRVVTTTSILGLRTRREDVLAPGRGLSRYESWDVYAASKLAASLMVREFARRNPDTEFCDVNPGFTSTCLIRSSWLHRALTRTPVARIADRFQTPLEDAGRALVTAASVPVPPSGYFDRGVPADPGRLVKEPDLAARVWERFAEHVAASDP